MSNNIQNELVDLKNKMAEAKQLLAELSKQERQVMDTAAAEKATEAIQAVNAMARLFKPNGALGKEFGRFSSVVAELRGLDPNFVSRISDPFLHDILSNDQPDDELLDFLFQICRKRSDETNIFK